MKLDAMVDIGETLQHLTKPLVVLENTMEQRMVYLQYIE